MKPLSGTFAQNALEHGVAGLWIDGARVGTFNDGAARSNTPGSGRMKAGGSPIGTFTRSNGSQPLDENLGRWPANLIHDGSDEVLAGFPESGNGSGQPTIVKRKRNKGWANSSPGDGVEAIDNYGDTGSAARFFYCAKASRRERNAGLEGMEARAATTYSNESEEGAATRGRRPRHDTPTQNFHPTVKPIALMRYLARLTKTPTGGVVLDPFMGSGSTGIGAILEGRDFIGIEQDAEYAEIADRRIAHWQAEAEPEQLQLV